MTTVLLLAVLAAASEESIAAERIATVAVVTRGAMGGRVIRGVRTALSEALEGRGLTVDEIGVLGGKRGQRMRKCFDGADCLDRLAADRGASRLVLVSLERKKRRFAAEVAVWGSGVELQRTVVEPSKRKEIAELVVVAVGNAFGDLEAAIDAVAAAEAESAAEPLAGESAGEAVPDVPSEEVAATEATREAAPAEVPAAIAAAEEPEDRAETVPSSESIPGELPRERDSQVTLDQILTEAPEDEDAAAKWEYREEAPAESFAVLVSAAGGFLPVQYNRTFLAVGDTLARQEWGFPAAEVGVFLRLPWRAVPDFYQTTFFGYGFNSTLLLVTADAGFEKRWPFLNGVLAPLLGVSAGVAFHGLPVPDGGGERLATAWAMGVHGYAGVVVSLHRRVALYLHAGYRYSLRRVTRFEAGGDSYYARDAHGDTWQLDLSGISGRLGASFEF